MHIYNVLVKVKTLAPHSKRETEKVKHTQENNK